MGFHLQLYPPKFRDWGIVCLVLFGPAVVAGYLSHSYIWFILTPPTIVVCALLIAALCAFLPKKCVSAEEFADALERHLLGTEGTWDWDDVTSIALADERLERIRRGLSRFDLIRNEKDREDFKMLIAAIRRGEFPEVVPPESLTYR